MKIIQIVAAYKPAYIYGGPTMSVSKLCEALVAQKKNLELEVFTTTANGKSELPVVPNESTQVDGVKVTYFKRLTKDHTHFSPALLSALKKVFMQVKKINRQQLTHNHQLIHIHAWWNLVSIFSCSIAKWYRIPVVLSPRGMLTAYTSNNRNSDIKGIIHRFMGKRLLQYCDIHATSEKEKEDVLAFIQPKSITVIPNLVNLPPIEELLIFKNLHHVDKNSCFKLLFLSRIEEKKGIELLFQALVNCTFNWQLTIAGTGEETYLANLKLKAESLNLHNRIQWIGHVNNEKKFQLMANNDLLVLTSYNENFANVVIESLSVGTAVLLSDQVGLADYVAANQLGWVTDLSCNTITHKLELAYSELGHRLHIRKTATQTICTDFNSIHLANRYIQLYQAIANGRL